MAHKKIESIIQSIIGLVSRKVQFPIRELLKLKDEIRIEKEYITSGLSLELTSI